MAITNAIMQMRRGLEADFDPDKMRPGEWAVSLDKKYVRMCFSVGVCVKMATYDAFEEDMAQIEEILSKCETIEEAVAKINTEVSANAKAVAEYTEQAKKYRDEAKAFRDEAENIAGIGVATKDKAGIVKPDGTTITVDEDGTIHASEGTTDYVDLENKPQIEGVELSGNKTLSELGIASADDLSTANDNINVNSEKISEFEVKVDTIIEKAELNIKNSASGENIHLTDSANSKVVEFGLYGKAEQNGEPTPDNPIEITVSGSDGSVEVVSCGKNLLKNNTTSKTINEVTFTVNEDGSVTANGTATADAHFKLIPTCEANALYQYNGCILSGTTGGSISTYMLAIQQKDSPWKMYGNSTNGDSVIKISDDDSTLVNFFIKICKDVTVTNQTFYPMIRLASDTDSTYEPYKETTFTIPTTDGLAGIPVSSGGNYADENGQQWICDEIVKYADGSGKRIQRIGKYILPNDSSYQLITNDTYDNYFSKVATSFIPNPSSGTKMLETVCTHFKKGNPYKESGEMLSIWAYNNSDIRFRINGITTTSELATWLESNTVEILYELVEPIITDLTAEEIAEIEKLYTFYPITNISNDADCGMAVTYIADSKLYIDNQLAIQKAQQEEALATMLLLMPEEVQASMIENDTNNLLNESEV